MIASAAIPGAFPPVMIDVGAGGRPSREMHAHGGTMSQVLVHPRPLRIKETSRRQQVSRERRPFVLRKACLDPDRADVDRRTLSIAGRVISSPIQAQGIGDPYRICLEAERDGVDFNLAYIPADFGAPHREEFDTAHMRALYQRGCGMAGRGYSWEKVPPGFRCHTSPRVVRNPAAAVMCLKSDAPAGSR